MVAPLVSLSGDAGSTGKSFLRNSSPNNFEPGQVDEFTIECRNLGNIQQMLLGHDSTGYNPSWHPQVCAAPTCVIQQQSRYQHCMLMSVWVGAKQLHNIPVELTKAASS